MKTSHVYHHLKYICICSRGKTALCHWNLNSEGTAENTLLSSPLNNRATSDSNGPIFMLNGPELLRRTPAGDRRECRLIHANAEHRSQESPSGASTLIFQLVNNGCTEEGLICDNQGFPMKGTPLRPREERRFIASCLNN